MSQITANSPHILLVEDSESIHALLVPHFELEGYQMTWIADGEKGAAEAIAGEYALLLLDCQLPGLGGVEICRRVKSSRPRLPILMITALNSEIDKVVALDAGADDYLTKPFGIHELLARIRARLRSVSAEPVAVPKEEEVLNFGDLTIDPARRQIRREGNLIDLTALEFDLVLLLAKHAGRPFSRATLLQEVWGLEAQGYEENVNQVVRRVRRKIEKEPDDPKYLLTARGIGYVFCERC